MNKNNKKPLCFIPARGGSKRISRKNIAMLQGKPLIAWTIDSARQSELFDKVYVSSEDDEILQIADNWGACPLKRRTELADDRVTLLELCLTEVGKLGEKEGYSDLYLLLPTSPFRKSSTIRKAWENYITSDADTLLSVVPCEYPPQWALTIEDNCVSPLYPIDYQSLRQDLTSSFIHDGGHLITKISSLAETKSFIGPKTLPFYVSSVEAVDIDEPIDLLWAEFILKKNNSFV